MSPYKADIYLTPMDEISRPEELIFLWSLVLRWVPRNAATHAPLRPLINKVNSEDASQRVKTNRNLWCSLREIPQYKVHQEELPVLYLCSNGSKIGVHFCQSLDLESEMKKNSFENFA